MERYEFVKTKDGSVGLYNHDVKDIYHSSHGAFSEAVQKFILPSKYYSYVSNRNKVSILDICYGIGYNTKAALYFGKLHNKDIKIEVDALEIDEELIFISPLVKDTVPELDLDLFLFNQISRITPEYISFIANFLSRRMDSLPFLNRHLVDFIKKYDLSALDLMVDANQQAFLHNIYYKYISNSMKNNLSSNKYADCSFGYHCEDARLSLKNLNRSFDFIFLDAFTPQKVPILWSIDFLSLIKSRMHDDSVIVTYSNSTPYRAALLELGFLVGKVIINGKQFGTVASLNKNNIDVPLDDFDIGLTKTAGGIVYRDPDLNGESSQIINNREDEKNISKRISTSSYKKSYYKS